MKTLTGALLALVIGAGLGAVTVVAVTAVASNDSTVTTSNQQPADVLDYGTKG